MAHRSPYPAPPIFGAPWEGYEHAPRIPVPVDRPCGWCTVPFTEEDQGHATPAILADGAPGLLYQHRECRVRSRSGSVAHQRGHCSCTGGTDPDPQTPADRRADAIAAWREWYGEG